MELYLNMVFEWTEKQPPDSVERLLAFDHARAHVWTISVFNPKAQPIQRTRAEIEIALDGPLARVLAKDPYAYLSRPEKNIKEKQRKHRDKAWNLISSLIEENYAQLFQFYARNSPVTPLANSKLANKTTIYRYLRRFFQRGQIKNSLLPSYDNCGWRDRINRTEAERKSNGKKHEKKKQRDGKKLGRPSSLSVATGEPLGVNISKHDLELFCAGIKLFYHKRERRPLKLAYEKTLERFFHSGHYQNKRGIWVAGLPPASQLPTYRQFKYWYKKERNIRRARVSREGLTNFNLTGRAKVGDSTQMASGPGALFQIDATIADVYLVSSLDRNWIIGRPVIYFIIDVFSHLIVGLSVALEGPSWLGAMLALENACTDKVAFCAEYAIPIDSGEWPTCHLPEALMGDRGELEGFNADHLVNAFNTTVHNTAPYRGDLKGIVEQDFDLCNEKIIRWLPGSVRKRQRGERDYRLDATLTLWEFRKVMIGGVLDHNSQQRLDNYRKDEHMISDHIEPYPINLWNWGVENRSGYLRKKDIETVRLNLLPAGEASVTQNGIRFAGLFYNCELARREQWLERAAEQGSWKIPVAHDPRTRSRIYLRLNNEAQIETCHLLPADHTFLDRDWYESLDEFELRKQGKESSQTRHQRSRAEARAFSAQVIQEATNKTAESRVDSSDRSRLLGIRENRKYEREREREANAWELGIDPKTSTTEPQPAIGGYVAPPQSTNKLRQIRERMMKK
jgi:putative transposase